MKLYLSHPRSHEYESSLYGPIESLGLDIFLPHKNSNPRVNTKQLIEGCDIVLAEVSHPATGSGIELGWANAAGVEIVCMHKKDAKIAGSLKYISDTFIEYTDNQDLTRKLTSFIESRT